MASYFTFMSTLWPAERVSGREGDETVNAVLELLSSVTCTADEPEFVMETVCEAPVPTGTSPKSTVDGVAMTVAVSGAENALERDPQPVSPTADTIRQANAADSPYRRKAKAEE